MDWIPKRGWKEELLYLPLLGKEIEILGSRNVNEIGLRGTILFESAHLLHLHIPQKGVRRLLKHNIAFHMVHRGKLLYMDGRLLNSTTVHRLKKLK